MTAVAKRRARLGLLWISAAFVAGAVAVGEAPASDAALLGLVVTLVVMLEWKGARG